MNKTLKRGLSLVIALVFAMSMMVIPTAFAYSADLGTEGWEVAFYADAAGTQKLEALEAGQEAYAKFALLNIRSIATFSMSLNATGLKFTEITSWDYEAAGSPLAEADKKLKRSTQPTDNVINAEGNKIVIVWAQNTDSGSIGFTAAEGKNKAFGLTGATAEAGVKFPVVTMKVKVNEPFDGTAKVEAAIEAGVVIGKMAGPSIQKSPIDTYNNCTNASVGYPEITGTPTLVNGNDKDAPTITAIDTRDGEDPTKQTGASYYFRASRTNGIDDYYKVINDAQVGTTKGAYINVATSEFALGDNETEKNIPVTSVTLVDPANNINKAITAAQNEKLFDIHVVGTTYTLDPKPVISIPAGTDTITIDAVKASLKKDEGSGYVKMSDTEIAALGAITLVGYDKATAKAGDSGDYTVSIAGLQLESAAVTVNTTAAIPTGKYRLKDKYVVYTATLDKDTPYSAPLGLLTVYTDGTTKDEGKTTTGYSITKEAWAAFCTSAETEGTYQVAITLTDNTVEAATEISLEAKDAIPTGKYRVAEKQPELIINYKGTVDISKIKFESEIKNTPTDVQTLWVNYVPTGKVTLSDFDNATPGEYTVTVSAAGITLDPATVTVNVKKEATYTAAWFNGEAPTLAQNIEDADIIDLLSFTAHYNDLADDDTSADAVTEPAELDAKDITITRAANKITVNYKGTPIGELDVTFDANATNAKADIPVSGVDLIGNLTTNVELDADPEAGTIELAVGANSSSNVKLLATVSGATDGTYTATAHFAGFTPVAVKIVVADGKATATVEGDLIAGYVAGDATKKESIDDNDFYAIAASLGETVAAGSAKEKYDLNRDGTIDVLDIEAVLGNLGTLVK